MCRTRYRWYRKKPPSASQKKTAMKTEMKRLILDRTPLGGAAACEYATCTAKGREEGTFIGGTGENQVGTSVRVRVCECVCVCV